MRKLLGGVIAELLKQADIFDSFNLCVIEDGPDQHAYFVAASAAMFLRRLRSRPTPKGNEPNIDIVSAGSGIQIAGDDKQQFGRIRERGDRVRKIGPPVVTGIDDNGGMLGGQSRIAKLL